MNLIEHGSHLSLALGLSLALAVQILAGFVELGLEGLVLSVARGQILLQLLDLGLGSEILVLGFGKSALEVTEVLGISDGITKGTFKSGLLLLSNTQVVASLVKTLL